MITLHHFFRECQLIWFFNRSNSKIQNLFGLSFRLTVSKLSNESTALALVALSFLFISLLYLVLHSVMATVTTEIYTPEMIKILYKVKPNYYAPWWVCHLTYCHSPKIYFFYERRRISPINVILMKQDLLLSPYADNNHVSSIFVVIVHLKCSIHGQREISPFNNSSVHVYFTLLTKCIHK